MLRSVAIHARRVVDVLMVNHGLAQIGIAVHVDELFALTVQLEDGSSRRSSRDLSTFARWGLRTLTKL